MRFFIGICFGIGLYLLLADYFRIPSLATSKAYNNLAKRQEKKTSTLDIWLGDLAAWISRHIKLNEYRREQLVTDLRSAGISLSPEAHIANSLVKSAFVGLMAVPAAFIFPIVSPIILVLAVLIYLKTAKGVADKIKEKRKKIEYELPRFVSYIEKTLRHNRDILSIIDGYMKTAGNEIRDEFEITAADMRSGNYEAALTRLESRVGSSMLSDVTRGLIGVLRGDETDAYWTNLAMKFADYQRTILKAEAAKVKRLSMCMLICFMLMYLLVIGMQIVTSLGGMFG